MLTDDGIYVRRNLHGMLELSKMVGDQRVHRIYMDYSVNEALADFRCVCE